MSRYLQSLGITRVIFITPICALFSTVLQLLHNRLHLHRERSAGDERKDRSWNFNAFSKGLFPSHNISQPTTLVLSFLPWYWFCLRFSHQYCQLFQKADSGTEKESPPTPILKSDPKKLQEWSTTILRLDPKNYHIWQVTLKCFTRVIQTCCQVIFLNVPPSKFLEITSDFKMSIVVT